MAITHTVYDTATLLGVFREFEPVQSFWLDLAFGTSQVFDDEFIDFSKIDDNRLLAPLVVPTAQGRPMYESSERTYRLKPAYIKPKDAINASQVIRRTAGQGELLNLQPLSPQQRYDAIIANMARVHNNAIRRRWEKMAADAILYGQVVLESESYPRTVVNFEREATHTVTLTSGNYWDDDGVDPVDNIETWVNLVHRARFSGPVNRMICGTDAWTALSKNARVKELLRNDLRQTSGTMLDLGPGDGTQVQYKGNLSANLPVWVYSDYYHDDNKATVDFMDKRDILLIGTNVRGVLCFGSIADKAASFQSLPIFPKMFDQDDPSATFLLTQSAPLPVPINPNNTFRARVVA